MRLRLSHLSLLAAVLVACEPVGPQGPAANPDAGDCWSGCQAVFTDAGTDAGVDGGPAALVMHFGGPSSPRRGPVLLAFQGSRPLSPGEVQSFELRFGRDGGPPERIAERGRLSEGSAFTVAWDSFVDVATDGTVDLELSQPDGGVLLPFNVDLRNAPSTARLLLVAQPSMPVDGGGSSPLNNIVSVLRWEGGAVAGSPHQVQVGRGPRKLKAAPHGRAVACQNDSDGTVTVLGTSLAAEATKVSILATLKLPWGWASDVAWSPEGRWLYVAGGVGADPATQPQTLWRFEPSEDLTQFPAPTPLAQFDRPLMQIAVEAASGRVYVVQGTGASAPKGRLSVSFPDGGLAAPSLDTDVGVPNDFAVSPAGGLGIVSSDLFGNELIRYGLGPTLTEVSRNIPTAEPFGLVFHPGSTQAKHLLLMSSYAKNSVTPYVITPSAITPGTPATGLSLAAEMDMVERGPEAGMAFVSALFTVARVRLNLDGTATKLTPAWTFPSGVADSTGAIGIQR